MIARTVSAALVGTVREIVSQSPAGLRARPRAASPHPTPQPRAWGSGGPGAAAQCCPASSRLWEPVTGPAQGIPYIVFAGNVGDDDALAAVVDTLRSV